MSRVLAFALERRRIFVPCFPRRCADLLRADPAARPQLLPVDRRRPDQPPCPRAGRHADRGDRRAVRPYREIASARSSRPTSSSRSSTISACRSAASTAPIPTPAAIGPQDGDILITLAKDHKPTAGYVRDLRKSAARQLSLARPSRSCPPTSSARSSTSVRRPRSTSRSRARHQGRTRPMRMSWSTS